MEIVGIGKTESTVSGGNTTYGALPADGYSFKYWVIGGENKTDNPITLPTGTEITSVVFYYDIMNYLKGMVAFDIPDANLYPILKRRNIEPDTDTDDMDDETKELLYADVLIWGSTLPSTYGNISESDGGWTHQEGSATTNAADKKRFESIANEIYRRYGDSKFKGDIRIVSLW